MADTKISALTAAAVLGINDLLPAVIDPAGTPLNRKITLTDLLESFVMTRRKAANENRTSTTTMTADADLVFPIAAQEVWVATYHLYVVGHQSGDFKASVTAPAGATIRFGLRSAIATAAGVESDNRQQAHTSAGLGGGTAESAAYESYFIMSVSVDNDSTAGDVSLAWSQLASHATATTLLIGSFMIAHRILV